MHVISPNFTLLLFLLPIHDSIVNRLWSDYENALLPPVAIEYWDLDSRLHLQYYFCCEVGATFPSKCNGNFKFHRIRHVTDLTIVLVSSAMWVMLIFQVHWNVNFKYLLCHWLLNSNWPWALTQHGDWSSSWLATWPQFDQFVQPICVCLDHTCQNKILTLKTFELSLCKSALGPYFTILSLLLTRVSCKKVHFFLVITFRASQEP